MTEMLLLGAGASAEAGVPTSYPMGREMYPRFKQLILPGMRNDYARAFAFIVGGLRFQQSGNWGDPYADVDVETLMSAAVALSNDARYASELAPFIQTWHPMIDDINSLHRESGTPDVFEQVAVHMRQMLADIVWVEDAAKVSYLAPIFALLQRQKRLVIATLNYDNTVELLARDRGIGCNTGIEGWSETGAFDVAGEGLHLLKLHGSVDWELFYESSSPTKPMTTTALRTLSDDEMRRRKADRKDQDQRTQREGRYEPALVFGTQNKLTTEGPFLDLLQAFKRELTQTDVLTIVGYSFRDAHINACITQWLNRDRNRRVQIMPKSFETSTIPYTDELRTYAQGQITVVPHYAKEGLEALYGEHRGNAGR